MPRTQAKPTCQMSNNDAGLLFAIRIATTYWQINYQHPAITIARVSYVHAGTQQMLPHSPFVCVYQPSTYLDQGEETRIL